MLKRFLRIQTGGILYLGKRSQLFVLKVKKFTTSKGDCDRQPMKSLKWTVMPDYVSNTYKLDNLKTTYQSIILCLKYRKHIKSNTNCWRQKIPPCCKWPTGYTPGNTLLSDLSFSHCSTTSFTQSLTRIYLNYILSWGQTAMLDFIPFLCRHV